MEYVLKSTRVILQVTFCVKQGYQQRLSISTFTTTVLSPSSPYSTFNNKVDSLLLPNSNSGKSKELKLLTGWTDKISHGKNKMSESIDENSATNQSGGGADGESGDRSKCIFCKIVDGKEGNEIYYQDDEFVVFQDIRPASTHHLLVVTREHIRDSKSLLPSHLGLVDRLVQTGNKVLLEQIQKQAPDTENFDQIRKLLGFHWPPFHTIPHLHLHVIAPTEQMGFISRVIFRPNSFWFVTPEYIKERLEKMAADAKSNPNDKEAE